jgi:hypothetical protein
MTRVYACREAAYNTLVREMCQRMKDPRRL